VKPRVGAISSPNLSQLLCRLKQREIAFRRERHSVMTVLRTVLSVFLLAAVGSASAQNLPPVAAPTVDISVAPLPVVRSQTESADDYSTGLLTGLVAGFDVPGIALSIVRDDHSVVEKSVGAVSHDTPFAIHGLGDLIETIAALQLVEQARMLPTDDAGAVLGDSDLGGVTVGALLAGRSAAPDGTLARLVSRVSGQEFPLYAGSHVLTPLGMAKTKFEGNTFTTSTEDITRLMIALVNGGLGGSNLLGRILQPSTVDLMLRTHFLRNANMPGVTYGFAESPRNGWRALVRDGEGDGVQTRMVIVPETRLAYFLVVRGTQGANFWTVLDGNLFSQLFPGRGDVPSLRGAPLPSKDDATRAAGIYAFAKTGEARIVFLTAPEGPLSVSAREDGALVLSGAASGVLLPRPGGWRSTEDGREAAASEPYLMLDGALFQRTPLWRSAMLYLWIGLAGALIGVGLYSWARMRPERSRIRPYGLGLLAFAGICAGAAMVFKLLA